MSIAPASGIDPASIDFILPFADEPITVSKAFDPARPEEAPILRGVGTSTTRDNHGDVFEESAVRSAQKTCIPGLSCFQGHDYAMPDKFMGRIFELPTVEWPGPDLARMRLAMEVETENPPAMRSYRFITKGSKFGFSGGFRYLEYDPIPGPRGKPSGFRVKEVETMEMSTTPVPSNPDAWIDLARKSLVYKGLLEPRDDDAQTLVLVDPYVALHWSDFESVDPVGAIHLKQFIERLAGAGLYFGALPLDRRVY